VSDMGRPWWTMPQTPEQQFAAASAAAAVAYAATHGTSTTPPLTPTGAAAAASAAAAKLAFAASGAPAQHGRATLVGTHETHSLSASFNDIKAL